MGEEIANYGDFFFNTINTLELVGKGDTWMGTTSVAAIYPRTLESVEYYVPIIEEQQMIG